MFNARVSATAAMMAAIELFSPLPSSNNIGPHVISAKVQLIFVTDGVSYFIVDYPDHIQGILRILTFQ